MFILSKAAQKLKPSPTLALAQKAKELQLQGKDVISLTLGEPDWSSFEVANLAGIEAIQNGNTKYTPAAGTAELKKAIAELSCKQLNVKFEAKNVAVSSGAKMALYSSLRMILDEADEVLIPIPYWVSYPTMVELCNAKSVYVKTSSENNFFPTFAELQSLTTSKTKAIIICSPNNPTGLCCPQKLFSDLNLYLQKNPNVVLISDDIYNRLIFNHSTNVAESSNQTAPHFLHFFPEMKSRVVSISGVSKTYSMTGWRLGWVIGPENFIKAVSDFLSQTTSNPSSISQQAALSAVLKGELELQKTLQVLDKRFQVCVQLFKDLKYFTLQKPQGAFYLWVNISKILSMKYKNQKLQNSNQISNILLEDFLVASVPGVEFGDDMYIRFCFTVSEGDLIKAIGRLKDFESNIAF